MSQLEDNIKNLATCEKINYLDNILDDFLRKFATLDVKEQTQYIHSRQFLKNVYDLGYDDGRKTSQICYANKFEL